MNIFNRIIESQVAEETTLGNPLRDSMAIARRLNYFATMTGGKGFGQPAKSDKGPKRDSQGKTRRDRREERFQRAFHGQE